MRMKNGHKLGRQIWIIFTQDSRRRLSSVSLDCDTLTVGGSYPWNLLFRTVLLWVTFFTSASAEAVRWLGAPSAGGKGNYKVRGGRAGRQPCWISGTCWAAPPSRPPTSSPSRRRAVSRAVSYPAFWQTGQSRSLLYYTHSSLLLTTTTWYNKY